MVGERLAKKKGVTMANDWMVVPVPAPPRLVQEFLKLELDLFLSTLKSVREQVSKAVQPLGIYKIYGRDEKQGGAMLKDARKVRLKFNTYFEGHKQSTGSLWSIPDIVGFTVVVAYPSDINPVAAAIDTLVDGRRLVNAQGVEGASPDADTAREKASDLIKTKHGRALTDKGYFACHYNLRLPGPAGMARADRPICEVQIKTVMHDAWGAKTHDLTYKPSGRTAQELIDSFNVLGDTLALIDRQSDLIRHSIERNARVREAKRRRLQQSVLTDAVLGGLVPETDDMSAVVREIAAFDPADSGEGVLADLAHRAEVFYAEKPRPCCAALCLLALRSNNRAIRQTALDTLDVWLQDAKAPLDRVTALMMTGLAAYCFDDPTTAIEATEAALETAISADSVADWASPIPVASIYANIYANLAYYHAVRVGSHEGTLGGSAHWAVAAAARVQDYVKGSGYPDDGLDAAPEAIAIALKDDKAGATVFSILDTAAFVRIQTTDIEPDVVMVLTKLKELHRLVEEGDLGRNWPMGQTTRALMIDYNDYCARMRLAELEARG
jgi:ppGpp synthetase/RelA/SpoT-type nucleotidyltranferase